jgi:hypothetical protein
MERAPINPHQSYVSLVLHLLSLTSKVYTCGSATSAAQVFSLEDSETAGDRVETAPTIPFQTAWPCRSQGVWKLTFH